jgi:hypothetical protein
MDNSRVFLSDKQKHLTLARMRGIVCRRMRLISWTIIHVRGTWWLINRIFLCCFYRHFMLFGLRFRRQLY